MPDGVLTKDRCKAYADSLGIWGGEVNLATEVNGCYKVKDTNKVYYNIAETNANVIWQKSLFAN